MRQTLFYIPHEIGPLSVFGWNSWLLYAWLLAGAVLLIRGARGSGWKDEVFGLLPMLGLVAACIVWLVPRIEEPVPEGFLTLPSLAATSGLPIRGYGVLLLLAVVASVALAVHRCQRAGLNVDVVFGLAFYMVVAGIIGARLFFIIQKWDVIRGETWQATLGNMASVVQGGLVVYGSLIGAAAGFLMFTFRRRLDALALADLVAPSLALGLAIGRLGCLLNGCCFGGSCDHDLPWLITFPAGSPAYVQQQQQGELHGLTIGPDVHGNVQILDIDPDGPLGEVDVAVGQRIDAINDTELQGIDHAQSLLRRSPAQLTLRVKDGGQFTVWLNQLPERSKPVQPTQIYSSINATLLFFLVLAAYPFRRRHGQVIALLLTLYAITRFLLEIVRTDESEFLGQMTISQNVSLAIGVSMLMLWLYVQWQPPLQKTLRSG